MREGIGYRAPVDTPKQCEQTITQCGKRMRGISLRRVPSIFAKRHISHVMCLILNRPMAAPQPFDGRCSGLRRRHAHHRIGHLTAAFASLEYDPFTLSSHHLLHIWPIDILDMRVATSQAARFQTTMPLFGGRSDALPHLVIGWVRRQRKQHIQILIQRGLILFDDHQIVAVVGAYLTCGWAQGVQGIKGHNFAVQVATFEQRRDSTPLIALECNLDLAKHPRVVMLHQRDQMTRMARAPNSAHGFAIDRHSLQRSRYGRRRGRGADRAAPLG